MRLHFTFVLLVVFIAVSVLGSTQSNASYAIFLLGSLVSVLLHELGHALVASRFGIRTTEIVMFPIGGLSRMERMLPPTAEICVALAGPLVNVLLAGGIFAYMLSTHSGDHQGGRSAAAQWEESLALLLYGNILLAGFNLLPAFPMDGGRILRALLSYIRPEEEATRTAAWMGRMLAISMGLYGLLAPQFMLVFFALFIYLGAAQESVAALGRSLTHGIPIRAAMITEVPYTGTPQHHSRRGQSAALDVATGFSGDARGPGGGSAGTQSADSRDRFGRAGRLRGGRDGSRLPGAGAERRSGRGSAADGAGRAAALW